MKDEEEKQHISQHKMHYFLNEHDDLKTRRDLKQSLAGLKGGRPC